MVTGTEVRIRHVATCPEVDPLSCAVEPLPEHWHDQHIGWVRLDPTLTFGLGGGWQASLSVPLDARVIDVDYELPDGSPYDPPYDDIHHRAETIAGPVDATLLGKRYVVVGDGAILGVGLGTTLPLGRTEEDPYALTEEGLRHQHVQLGTGTFVPMATVEGVLEGVRWGGLVWVTGRLPLYANTKGYEPGPTASVGLGPSFRVTPRIQVHATGEGSFEGPEKWSGTPYGSRATVVGGLGAAWSVTPRVVVQAQTRVTAWQWTSHEDHDEGSAVQRLLGTVGVSWTFDVRKPAAETTEP